MYSVVLVMALAGSTEAPDCHWGRNSCGCWGSSYSGCYGGYSGGCYGGGYGSSYGGGCYGGGVYGGGVQGGVYQTPAQPMPGTGERIGEPKKGKDQANVSAPGTIVVTLPANARLTIDGGYVSQQNSPQRVLVTPPIQPGEEFTYTLVAEVTQDGQPVSQSQRVTVRPGQQSPVSFNFTTTPTAASR